MYFEHFLGVDIMALAPRVNDAAKITSEYEIPTMEATDCVVCHKVIDPVAGLLQDYYALDGKGVYGPRKEGWYQDMFGPGLYGEDLPDEQRWRSLQWLGERTVQDPRFAVAMVKHVWYILYGRKPMLPPEDIDDPLFSAKRRAYQAQRNEIEQIAARLNWPCLRINLDGHISRFDLLGKDAIKLNDGKQITEFQEGLLPWSIQNPVALVFDEYDAGRPDVMFVIQRILEVEGKLTLLDQNKILEPNASFRLFATTNTVGLGDMTGLYHGTQQINQGQMDRWHILATLNYLDPDQEYKVVMSKLNNLKGVKNQDIVKNMIKLANLTRTGFANGDISTLMSPRTVISWGQNFKIFKDIVSSFKLTFLNKCDEVERSIISEYFQRCFDLEIDNTESDS